jgi:hypothetical protein
MKSLGFKIKKKYFAQDKNNPLFDTGIKLWDIGKNKTIFIM